MSEYEQELKAEFIRLIYDPVTWRKLSYLERKKFNGFKNRLNNDKAVSEKAMRECVEKYSGKRIIITRTNGKGKNQRS